MVQLTVNDKDGKSPAPKYLFIAEYDDGTLFLQNKEDVSAKDPKRSAYYDVDQERLTFFILVGKKHSYAVNLRDGSFEVDKTVFRFHEEGDLPPDTKLRLIFFRRHKHQMNAQFEELSHTMVFRIGWQATISVEGGGEGYSEHNIQRVMEID